MTTMMIEIEIEIERVMCNKCLIDVSLGALDLSCRTNQKEQLAVPWKSILSPPPRLVCFRHLISTSNGDKADDCASLRSASEATHGSAVAVVDVNQVSFKEAKSPLSTPSSDAKSCTN